MIQGSLGDTLIGNEAPEILPPYEDGVFKSLLTRPEAKPVLRGVASAILLTPVRERDRLFERYMQEHEMGMAVAEGEARGLAKGRAEATSDMLRMFIADLANVNRPAEDIVGYTGLTKAQVDEMRARIG